MRTIKILVCVLIGTFLPLVSGQAQTGGGGGGAGGGAGGVGGGGAVLTNSLSNGSFESPVQGPPLYQTTYSRFGAGIPDWTVTDGFVDIVNPERSTSFAQNIISGTARDGNQVLNLASGTGTSAIRQDYTVSANDAVTLTFSFGTAQTLAGDGEATIEVVFGGTTTTFNLQNDSQTINWTPRTITNLVLSGGAASVEFRSDDDPFDSITLIDNVQVGILRGALTNSALSNLVQTNMTGGTNLVLISQPTLPGEIDPTFDAGGGFANVGISPVTVRKSVILPSGKLMFCGSFASYRGVSTPNFARVNNDGTLDTSFFHGYGASSRCEDFVIQADNRIVVVGAFDAFHEINSRGIARLLENGEPDRSFRPGNGCDGAVNAVDLDSAGNIIIGGEFETCDATNRAGIARLHSNGKLDLSFDPGTGFVGTVNDLIVLANGQILVAGQFTSYNGFSRSGVVRLNPDGTLDTAFVAPFESTANVKEIVLASDGKIYAGGEFNLLGSNGRRNIARLNADGSLDVTWGASTLNAGANASVNAISVCGDGTLLIGGDFTTVDGAIRARMAKLGQDGLIDRSSQVITTPQVVTNQVVSTNFHVVMTTNIGTVSNIFFVVSNNMQIFLSTNTLPAATQTNFAVTNAVVVTNQAVVQSLANVYTFGINGGANASVTDIVADSSDRPYVSGSFSTIDSVTANGLVRLQSCNPTIASAGGVVQAAPTPGTIAGVVTDAVTGAPLVGASISNAFGGVLSALDGSFTLTSAVVGTNELVFSRAGYATFTNSFFVPSATVPGLAIVSMSPTIADTNTIRLVLTWDAEPSDLDSHLVTPAIGGAPQTVFFGNRGSLFSPPFAELDVDDVTGFGPETITITNIFPGIYNYFIHRFSGAVGSTFTNSGARVRVFNHTGLIGTIDVNPNDIVGDYWHVLQIDGSQGTFAVINAVSNGVPTVNTNVAYSGTIGFGAGPAPPMASIGPPGPPRIDVEPQDDYELAGGTAMLSVGVSGSLPFSFQWYHNGDLLSGATGPNLVVSNLNIASSGDYHVVVTNPLGNATSTVAQVAVISQTAPFVFLQPSPVAVDVGGTATFEIIAGGSRPLFYEWRKDGVVVPNAGGPFLTLTNVQLANVGSYRITVANSFGNVFSKSVDLTVATPPAITQFTFDPSAQVASGTPLTMSVAATGKGPFDYFWFFNGAFLPTAVNSNLTFPSVHFTNAGQYTVIVSNILGSATNGPNTLLVDSPPIITVEPQNQFQTIGRSANLSVTVIGTGPIGYQWRKDGVNIAGETGDSLSFTNIQPADVGFYSVEVSNAFGTVTSRLARVDVVLERALLPWVANYGGAGIDVGESVAVDSNGNVYVCGKFTGTAQFGTNSLVSAGLEDIFIARLDASGNTIWAKRIGGAGFDVAKDIVTDSNGDIIVTGSFQGVVDFGGTTLTNLNATSFDDIFVVRYTSDGNLVWARRDGVSFVNDIGNSLAVDATQNIYLAGSSTLGSFGSTTFSNYGRILLAKYDALGNQVWARKSGGGPGGSQDTGESVAVDSSGNVFVAATFQSGIITNDLAILSNRGFSDGYVAKYDPNGVGQWIKQIGGVGADAASGVATVGTNVVVAGRFSATATIDNLSLVSAGGVLSDGFVVKLDGNGNVMWSRSLGGNGADAVRDVATDSAGEVYITGFFQGTANFGSRTSISIAGTTDIFASRLRSDGTFEFVQQAGGDDISGEVGNGIAVDSAGNGVFTGSFHGTLVAGGASLISGGLENVFVSRLVSPPTLDIQVSGSQLTFSWPSFWTGFAVQVNDQFLRSTNWQNVSLANSNQIGNRIYITNNATTNVQFFRLLRQ